MAKYKYGFSMPEDNVFKAKRGLDKEVVSTISAMKKEPEWMTQNRIKAYEKFLEMKMPNWGADLSGIDFANIFYYVKASSKTEKSWNDVPNDIKETYDRLGIPEAEKEYLGGVKAQYESEVVYGSLMKRFSDQGIIFCGMDEALIKYPKLIKEYFGKLIPMGDNKFAALNTAVWSGGSFIYVPKNVKVDLPLQAYFRINSANMGQFERTLMIIDEGAFVHYVEGCFLAGAKLKIRDGLVDISTAKIGEDVLTHTGKWKPITNVIKRKYSGDVYKIKYYGDSSAELNVTEEHPLLVSRRVSNRDRNKKFKLEWIFAKDLDVKDYLVMPIEKEIRADKEFVGKVKYRKSNKSVEEKVVIPLEPDFFRLMGYFFAEGHIDNEHYVSFSFNKDETEYLSDVKKLVFKYFGKEVIENKVRQNGQTLVVCSTKYARLLSKEIGSTINDKKIPDWLLRSNNENVSELIKGMWRGDGSYDKKTNMFRYNSVLENLAYGYRDILLRLGILVDINLQNRKLPRKNMYVVLVMRNMNTKFAKLLGVKGIVDGVLRGSPVSMDEKYLYLPVKSIIKENFKGYVFNLSVEDDETYVCEGVVSHNCTAPIYSTDSLHSAVVEIFVKKGARCRYTTIQNWSKNVYNLVTKRATVEEDGIMEWVDGNLGSKVTMKYPAVVLTGKRAHGEILSVAVAGKGQHQDAGGKCVHLAPDTTSRIISKSISLKGGRSSYRGLIQINPGAKNARSKVVCDALILDKKSRSDTYPVNKINEAEVTLEHEATVSKIGEEQIFYLMSRGFTDHEAEAMIVNGFIEPIVKELPMEYSVELNRLINMQMEGSVG